MKNKLDSSYGLPQGVLVRQLTSHGDHRGSVTEIFRQEWNTGIEPIQWNCVHSQPNVLRGVHVHHIHQDYLFLAQGRMLLGLYDLREDSPSYNVSSFIELRGENAQTVTIPTGVAHGFYFTEPSTLIYSVSHYWNRDDELGCKWNAPELNLPWPTTNPSLSQRDLEAGSFQEMLLKYQQACKKKSES